VSRLPTHPKLRLLLLPVPCFLAKVERDIFVLDHVSAEFSQILEEEQAGRVAYWICRRIVKPKRVKK
jgi:hypothetical protein